MRSTDEASTVTSTLRDVREVPVTELLTLTPVAFDEALARVLPDSLADRVPVAAFNSAI